MSYDKFSELILFILERVLGHKSRDIMHALASLNYPHKFNKSYLKTPTAEHAYGHMVIMLGWLVDLMEGEHLEYEGEWIYCLSKSYLTVLYGYNRSGASS